MRRIFDARHGQSHCSHQRTVSFVNMAEGVDSEILITLVQERPILWDKTLESYKDGNLTQSMWREVNFSSNSSKEADDIWK